jgi:hypothetical protein
MAIHKLKHHQNEIPYEMVSREVAQSITNPNALAIWLYLLTKPEDWIVRRTDIKKHFSIGDVGYKKAIDHLVELGLFHKEFVRSESGLFTDSIIHIYPVPNRIADNRIADNRNSDKSIDGEPDNRITSTLKENRLFKEEEIYTEKNAKRTVCPYEDIREIYCEELPMLTGCRKMDAKTKKQILAIWKSDKQHQNLDFWRIYFRSIKRLTNRMPNWSGEFDGTKHGTLELMTRDKIFARNVNELIDQGIWK